jgi:hypothetical protein
VAGAVLHVVLLGLTILAVAACVLGPVAVLGFMLWQWQKELRQSIRLRQARTTQFR